MGKTLLEEFVILLLHPRRGRLMSMGNTLSQAVAVAALTDLLLSGLIVLEEGKVKVKSLKFSGRKVPDYMIRKIHSSGRLRTFKQWSGRFFFKGDRFLRETLGDLVHRNVLYVRDHHFLFFPYRRYFLIREKERDQLISELQSVVFGEDLPDFRQAVLLQLLASCNLSRLVARDRESARIFRRKIKEYRKDERITGAYAGILGEVKKTVSSAAVTG